MDWTATFRRLAGLAADPAVEDGIDLLPILTGDEPQRKRTLFWRRKKGPVRKSVEEGRAVRYGRWKLVEQATGERYLFDLEADVGESRNLIDQNPELADRLSAELDAWERHMDHPSP
jgi:arylsulfatase A-like enzyme